MKKFAMAMVVIAASFTVAVADDDYRGKKDFGKGTELQLNQQSQKWFRFNKPLAASTNTVIVRRTKLGKSFDDVALKKYKQRRGIDKILFQFQS